MHQIYRLDGGGYVWRPGMGGGALHVTLRSCMRSLRADEAARTRCTYRARSRALSSSWSKGVTAAAPSRAAPRRAAPAPSLLAPRPPSTARGEGQAAATNAGGCCDHPHRYSASSCPRVQLSARPAVHAGHGCHARVEPARRFAAICAVALARSTARRCAKRPIAAAH